MSYSMFSIGKFVLTISVVSVWSENFEPKTVSIYLFHYHKIGSMKFSASKVFILVYWPEDGKPYDFSYVVKDNFGNDFSHNARSDGDLIIGEYQTLLPDGRVQLVRYQADSINGYTAQVSYLGTGDENTYSEPRPEFSPGIQSCRIGMVMSRM